MRGDPSSLASRFSREQSMGFLAYRLSRSFSRALDRRLAKHGVPVGQFRLLLILWEKEQEGLTQTEIARLLDIEQPSVANALGRMERDGLITTSPDPSDRRRVMIRLSDKGYQLKGPLTAEAQYVNELATEGLTEDELQRLRNDLLHLIEALDRDVPQ